MVMNENVEVPLTDFVRETARVAARTVIDEHINSCILHKRVDGFDRRMVVLERRFYLLLGAIAGSGVLGGTIGGMIMRM